MGMNESVKLNKTFLSINSGQFAKRVPEGEGVARKVEYKKDGKKVEKTVYEKLFKSVTGMIDSVEIKDATEFGDQLNINMSDVGETWTVSIGLGTKEARFFIQCLPNIDLKQYVTLAPYNFTTEDNEKRIGMNVLQGQDDKGKGIKVPFYYTRENGLPMAPEKERLDTDEFKLKMSEQSLYLKKATKKFIAENFPTTTSHKPGKIEPNKAAENDLSWLDEKVNEDDK